MEPEVETAYMALMARVAEAAGADALLALVPELAAFEGGAYRWEFRETWRRVWRNVVGDDPPAEPWRAAR